MEIIFTPYAEWRCEKRKILKEEVIDAVRRPDKTIRKEDKHFYRKKTRHGVIEVCTDRIESYIRIKTVYWD